MEYAMLWTLFVLLLLAWFLGIFSHELLGGFIHVLLALAVLALVTELGLAYRRKLSR
jgi:hypothetical protein